MKQNIAYSPDILTLRADDETPATTAQSQPSFLTTLVSSLPGILDGTGHIISAANTSHTYTENRDTKTININNGTTIAAIIAAAIIIATVAVVLIRRK